ncbi:MAG TPA: glucose-6-phosphate isomerase, partial [Allosphingosinicella sp.]|nr:glucose-6-phosphate isomerase [Allosphingosinicella sp.]
MSDDAWNGIGEAASAPLAALFASEPDRLERLVVEEAGIRFDFAKTHLSEALVAAFLRLADEAGLAARRDALFAGEIVN